MEVIFFVRKCVFILHESICVRSHLLVNKTYLTYSDTDDIQNSFDLRIINREYDFSN